MIIREMTIDDYDEVYEMWQITTKRALSKADERDQMERYLKHNAGMSQVAVVDGKIVGTVLAGHDGRRGFIHHMAVPQTGGMGTMMFYVGGAALIACAGVLLFVLKRKKAAK